MMGTRWNLDSAEVALSEAAVDPSRWDAAMEAVAEATGSFGALLLPLRGRLPNAPKSRSLAASFDTYIRDGWVHRVRFRVVPTILCRRVATEFDFTTPDKMARHPYFQDFLAPHGLRWFAGVKFGGGDDPWVLSMQRSIAQGPFSPREQQQLAALSVRLSGVAALARALGFARTEAALAAFEVTGSAIVLLDRSRKCCGSIPRRSGCSDRDSCST
jgi:hypothetical protein